MSTVSEMVSGKIGSAIANIQTWGELFVNVKDFGAKGDGSTDDTQEIQKAINRAIELDKKALLFPTGKYKVTSLDNLDQVLLFGDNSSFVTLDEVIRQIGYFISPDELIDLRNNMNAIEVSVDDVNNDLTTEIIAREELERRVNTILNEPTEGKDAELVDVRTPAAGYVPDGPIEVAGDMTRDMQKQSMAHRAETTQHHISVNESKWGIAGDGVKNDTEALRSLFAVSENSSVDLCGKVFKVSKGFTIPQHCTVLGKGAVFNAELSESIPNYTGENNLINMSSNSSLFDVTLNIINTNPLPPDTQRLHVSIGNFGTGEGSCDVEVNGITILGGYDGYNGISVSGQSKNITIKNIYVPDNANLLGVIHTTWGGFESLAPIKRSPSNIVIENVVTGNMSFANSYVIWSSSAFNVKIRNIYSIGSSRGIVVQAGDFGSVNNDPIESLFIGKNYEISNVALYNCRVHGLFVWGRATVATSNDVELPILIENYRAYGTESSNSGVQVSYTKNIRFENCFFSGFNFGLLTQNGVDNLLISHCEFTGNRSSGITLGGSADIPKNIVIEKSNIHGNNTLKASNTGASAGLNGIYGKNVIIKDCNFGEEGEETQYNAVRLENTCSLVKMSNNHCWGVAAGGAAYRTSDQSNYINMKLEFVNNTAEQGITLRSGAVAVNTIDSGNKVVYQNAAPTTGTWARGDIVYNITPTAGGFLGWVCVTAGTPGTWKSFGAIEA